MTNGQVVTFLNNLIVNKDKLIIYSERCKKRQFWELLGKKKVSTGGWKNILLIFKGECMRHGRCGGRVQENKMKKSLTASDKKYIFFLQCLICG